MNTVSEDIRVSCNKILSYLTVRDNLVKSDAIFVAGGRYLKVVEKAAEIFKKKLADYLVFVGKRGLLTDPGWKSEAEEYHKRLLSLDIPENKMLWEPLSTNTLEDTRYCFNLIDKNNLKVKRLILIGRPFHQRRLWATFKKQFPNIEYVNTPSDENYDLTPGNIERLIGEIDRIRVYAAKGDIEEQILPEDVLEAETYLKSTLHL